MKENLLNGTKLTVAEKDGGGTMTMPDTEDYIVFDRTGTPHVVVAVKTEIGGNCQQECPNIINDWEDK